MSLKSQRRWPVSIPIRLAFFYTCIFALFVIAIFLLLYFLLDRYLQSSIDHFLMTEGEELQMMMRDPGISERQVKEEVEEEEQYSEGDFILYCIRNGRGKILAASDNRGVEELLCDSENFPWERGMKTHFATRKAGGNYFRSVYLPHPSGKVLIITKSIEKNILFLALFVKLFLSLYLLLLVIFWILGYFMIRNTLHPVHRMTEIARDISAGNLCQKIPAKNTGDELDELALTLNDMLGRIDSLITALKEKNDNLAHSMKTPLSRIRLDAEVTLLRSRSSQEYMESLKNCLGECDILLEMIDTMLDISEEESGIHHFDTHKIDIDEMMDEIVEIFRDMAKGKNLVLLEKFKSGAIVLCNRKKLRQAIVNIIENAIKYTPDGGKISLGTFTASGFAAITVKDNGIGIVSGELQRICERFYRSENSRAFPGVGLGLSYAKAVIEACKGQLEIQSEPGQGSVFSIYFPILNTE